LIVEDDADLRALIVILFEESALEIVECESAEAALATMLMRGRDVAMIFADVRLPGAMDGFDLAREAKVRWPHLTVVLTSGNPGRRIQALPPHVIYLPKPWDSSKVLALAERVKPSRSPRSNVSDRARSWSEAIAVRNSWSTLVATPRAICRTWS
jgi:DNA-binding NtrC family response regulator